jgi:dihydroorotase
MSVSRSSILLLAAVVSAWAQPAYDLLVKGGHVIDPKNKLSAVMDVAVAKGRIARVAANIPAASAKQVVNAAGLYVTPGLVDIHVHVYAGTGLKALTGDSSIYPDTWSFRTGVTTMVDAGTSGWRNFADFRQRVIDRAKTRVYAFLNISDVGMAPTGENSVAGISAVEAIQMARTHKDIIVGYKVAHFAHGGWTDIDAAVAAGKETKLPVMVDFGKIDQQRNLETLLNQKLRAGDIYTHCYSGRRDELLPGGKLNPAMRQGRQRGVLFDLGHGGASFYWLVAVPAFAQQFLPDSISTDLHTGSMNAGMKDLPNVMSKVLNLGATLEEVIRLSTWSPAQQIQHPELGNLDVGAEADIAVLRLEHGKFGFLDGAGARMDGNRRITAEATIRKGSVVYDLNGIAATDWRSYPYEKILPIAIK